MLGRLVKLRFLIPLSFHSAIAKPKSSRTKANPHSNNAIFNDIDINGPTGNDYQQNAKNDQEPVGDDMKKSIYGL